MAVRAGCCCSTYFYPRPPRGGRLQRARQRPARFFISIHALREEGDLLDRWEEYSLETFLSTPSARRATRSLALAFRSPRNFYPRPPRGGRPRLRVLDPFVLEISIHALREEGDTIQSVDKTSTQSFLSTPSARRATRQAFQVQKYYEISIHALREEGDLGRGSSKQSMANFYPRPPRGGRQFFPVLPEQSIGFLSTPSARRATLCGRIRNQKDIRFLSTPSARRATPAQ